MEWKKKTARHTLMDHLSRRDHSEKELRLKLKKSRYEYTTEQIEDAILFAQNHGWMKPAKQLAESVTEQLHRQKKGIRAIHKKLLEKGLPMVKSDDDLELEKALQLAEKNLSRKKNDPQKIGRLLISRGFEPAIVRKVIYEKLKK